MGYFKRKSDNVVFVRSAINAINDAILTGATVTADVKNQSTGAALQSGISLSETPGGSGSYYGTYLQVNNNLVGIEKVTVEYSFNAGAGLILFHTEDHPVLD